MKTKFKSPKYPALAIQVGNRKYKFSGGTLTVGPGEAAGVQKWADARKHLGIIKVGTEPEAAPPAPNMDMTKAELVKIARGMGFEASAAEAMTKAELIDAMAASAGAGS